MINLNDTNQSKSSSQSPPTDTKPRRKNADGTYEFLNEQDNFDEYGNRRDPNVFTEGENEDDADWWNQDDEDADSNAYGKKRHKKDNSDNDDPESQNKSTSFCDGLDSIIDQAIEEELESKLFMRIVRDDDFKESFMEQEYDEGGDSDSQSAEIPTSPDAEPKLVNKVLVKESSTLRFECLRGYKDAYLQANSLMSCLAHLPPNGHNRKQFHPDASAGWSEFKQLHCIPENACIVKDLDREQPNYRSYRGGYLFDKDKGPKETSGGNQQDLSVKYHLPGESIYPLCEPENSENSDYPWVRSDTRKPTLVEDKSTLERVLCTEDGVWRGIDSDSSETDSEDNDSEVQYKQLAGCRPLLSCESDWVRIDGDIHYQIKEGKYVENTGINTINSNTNANSKSQFNQIHESWSPKYVVSAIPKPGPKPIKKENLYRSLKTVGAKREFTCVDGQYSSNTIRSFKSIQGWWEQGWKEYNYQYDSGNEKSNSNGKSKSSSSDIRNLSDPNRVITAECRWDNEYDFPQWVVLNSKDEPAVSNPNDLHSTSTSRTGVSPLFCQEKLESIISRLPESFSRFVSLTDASYRWAVYERYSDSIWYYPNKYWDKYVRLPIRRTWNGVFGSSSGASSSSASGSEGSSDGGDHDPITFADLFCLSNTNPNFSGSTIRRNFRELSKLYHADKENSSSSTTSSSSSSTTADQRFMALVSVKERLLDIAGNNGSSGNSKTVKSVLSKINTSKCDQMGGFKKSNLKCRLEDPGANLGAVFSVEEVRGNCEKLNDKGSV